MAPERGFDLAWRLTVEAPHADTLAEALAPETEDEHAHLETTGDRLVVTGEGDAGACLHTLDDVLACLTAAVDALEID